MRGQNRGLPASVLEFHPRFERSHGRGVEVKELRISDNGNRHDLVRNSAATLFAVAKHFGFAASAPPALRNQLTADCSFLDPLTAEEQTRLDAANTPVFKAALGIKRDGMGRQSRLVQT